MKKMHRISLLFILPALAFLLLIAKFPMSEAVNSVPNVKSINGYEFLGIRFYEGPAERIPYGQRKYATNFFKDTTRYIYTEFNFSNPYYHIKDTSFPTTVEYLSPDGSVMTTLKDVVLSKKEWKTGAYWTGWGTTKPGKAFCRSGIYRVNVYFEDVLVGTSQFTIK